MLLHTGATSREGTVYPSRAPEFTPDVSGFVLLLRVPLVEKELSTHPEAPEFTPDVRCSGLGYYLRVPLVEKELSTHPEQMNMLLGSFWVGRLLLRVPLVVELSTNIQE